MMKLKHTVETAFEGLRTNRSRSLLTILGIVIGVAAIIIVMAIGDGAESLILDEISGLGQETVIIRPGSGLSDPANTLLSNSLTIEDIEALQRSGNVPNLESIYPYLIVSGTATYKDQTYRPTMYAGSVGFFAQMLDIETQAGRLYGQEATDTNDRVVVIGPDVKDELFGLRRAVGKDITINNRDFEVVGVFSKEGQVAGFNFDNMVMMPQTTARLYLTGNDSFQEVIAQADNPENVDKLVYDISATLREQHDIEPGEEDDFDVQTQENLIDQISTVTTILSAFLIAMVSISLVVGGIGIMNIMLVSVSERTKEIGLRKALGATRFDILRQFLLEAVMLTLAGGVVGILVGSIIAWGASVVLSVYVVSGWSFSFPIVGALIGVGVSTAIGLIFGIYPAQQAARKSPIEALRYE